VAFAFACMLFFSVAFVYHRLVSGKRTEKVGCVPCPCDDPTSNLALTTTTMRKKDFAKALVSSGHCCQLGFGLLFPVISHLLPRRLGLILPERRGLIRQNVSKVTSALPSANKNLYVP
jgi:hypothetical protein